MFRVTGHCYLFTFQAQLSKGRSIACIGHTFVSGTHTGISTTLWHTLHTFTSTYKLDLRIGLKSTFLAGRRNWSTGKEFPQNIENLHIKCLIAGWINLRALLLEMVQNIAVQNCSRQRIEKCTITASIYQVGHCMSLNNNKWETHLYLTDTCTSSNLVTLLAAWMQSKQFPVGVQCLERW